MNRRQRSCLQCLSIAVAAALLVSTSFTHAQQPAASAPAAAPGQGPATTAPAAPIPPADQSTPRGALRVLTEGMTRGDGNAIRSVLKSDSPQENQILDTLVGVYDATAKFGKTAEDAFGPEEARKLTGDKNAMLADQLTQLAIMPEKVDGDTATVGEPTQQVQLSKVDGKWRVPVGKLVGDKEPGQVDQVLNDMRTQTKIVNEVTGEIKAEKYKTAEEALQAMQLRMMKAAMEAQGAPGAGAATQPGAGAGATSQPTTKRSNVQ